MKPALILVNTLCLPKREWPNG